MTEVKIDSENIVKAHKEGCSDVKKVLENLFPETLKPKIVMKSGQIWRLIHDISKLVIITTVDGLNVTSYCHLSPNTDNKTFQFGIFGFEATEFEFVANNIKEGIEKGLVKF